MPILTLHGGLCTLLPAVQWGRATHPQMLGVRTVRERVWGASEVAAQGEMEGMGPG